jgi:hypothetical protein
MTLLWREEALLRAHNRKGFDCGNDVLNDYLVRYARQNHESGGAKTFVAVPPDDPVRILGYSAMHLDPGWWSCSGSGGIVKDA